MEFGLEMSVLLHIWISTVHIFAILLPTGHNSFTFSGAILKYAVCSILSENNSARKQPSAKFWQQRCDLQGNLLKSESIINGCLKYDSQKNSNPIETKSGFRFICSKSCKILNKLAKYLVYFWRLRRQNEINVSVVECKAQRVGRPETKVTAFRTSLLTIKF